MIRLEALPREIRSSAYAQRGYHSGLLPLAEMERRHIQRVVDAVGGNRARAAAALGIGERTLYRKLKEYGLARD